MLLCRQCFCCRIIFQGCLWSFSVVKTLSQFVYTCICLFGCQEWEVGIQLISLSETYFCAFPSHVHAFHQILWLFFHVQEFEVCQERLVLLQVIILSAITATFLVLKFLVSQFMVFNATFNNILAISWWVVLLFLTVHS